MPVRGFCTAIIPLMLASGPAYGAGAAVHSGFQGHASEAEEFDFADHIHHVVGAKFLVLGELTENETEAYFGPGLVYELTVIPHWLELELSGAAVMTKGEIKFPFDVIVKKPFVVNRVVDLFVGAGAMVNLAVEEDRTRLHPGIIGSMGFFVWLRQQAGIFVEFDYAYVAQDGVSHELEAACGLATRFR